jgi:hypothetical protein
VDGRIEGKTTIPTITAIPSAAMPKKAQGSRYFSTDIKNRPFLARFGRKKAIRAKENDTCFCVFSDYRRFYALQAVAGKELTSTLTLQKKSYLKTYGRFFDFGHLW